MRNRDIPDSDHPERDVPDSEIEALISGTSTPGGLDGVAGVFDQLRSIPEHDVSVGVQLGEFVTPRQSPAQAYELVLEATTPADTASGADPSKRLAHSALARMALVAGIGIAGVTGAHASGLINVPGLPSDGDVAELVAADTADAALGSGNAVEAPAEQPRVNDPAPAIGSDPKIAFSSGDDGEITADLSIGGLSASVRITNNNGTVTVDIDVEGVSPGCETAIEAVHEISDTPKARATIEAAEAACANELALIGPLLGDGEALTQLLEGLELDLDLPEQFGDIDELFTGEFGELFGRGFDIENFDPQDFERLLEDFEFPEGLGKHLEDLLGAEGEAGIFGGGFDFERFSPEDLERLFENLPLPEEFEHLFSEGFDPEELEADLEDLLSGLEADLGVNLEDLLETFGTNIYGEDD